MKYIARTLTASLVAVCLTFMNAACGTEEGTDALTNEVAEAEEVEDNLPEDAIKRGDAELFGEAPLAVEAEFVPFDDIIADPESYVGRVIQTEGIVRRVCKKRGCWMELRSLLDATSENITVRFLDYGFFVPLDSRGGIVRVEGTAAVRTLSVEEVQELIAEGYDPGIIEEDGTATVVTFTASGVEMWNRNED